jgi:polyisoprenyl-phosphate glycosyltransferase
MPERRLLTIVVPVLNEEANIEPLYRTVKSVLAALADRYDYEFLFTDNHSTDGTFPALQRLADHDPRVRVLRFSRNFGFQRSIFTGYAHAAGDAAIQIDCDLQDPPGLILQFVRKWEEGYHVVYGVRASRKEGFWLTGFRKTFYRLIDSLSEDDLPHDAGDFRLLDRRVLNELRNFEDYQPYLRGTIATLGFNQIGIPYERAERLLGKSKFSFRQLVGLALDGILNHSIVPLRFATYLGLLVSVLTLLASGAFLVGKFLFGQQWPPGFAMLTILILGSLSLNALFLGIIGEYLGRIYQQVKKRPLTIIEREINASGASQAEALLASRKHAALREASSRQRAQARPYESG